MTALRRSAAKQEFKRFDPADLKPLTEEERKRLFPNGPVSMEQLKERKKLKQHKDHNQ
jgi:hypothetical protein